MIDNQDKNFSGAINSNGETPHTVIVPSEPAYLRRTRKLLTILYTVAWCIVFFVSLLPKIIASYFGGGQEGQIFGFLLSFQVPFYQILYAPWLYISIALLGLAMILLRALHLYKNWTQKTVAKKVSHIIFLLLLVVSVIPFLTTSNGVVQQEVTNVVKNITASEEKNKEQIEAIRKSVDFAFYLPKPGFEDSELGKITEIKSEYGKERYEIAFTVLFSPKQMILIQERSLKDRDDSFLQEDRYRSKEWIADSINGEQVKYFEESYDVYGQSITHQWVFFRKDDVEIIISNGLEKIPKESLFNLISNFQEFSPGRAPLTNHERYGFDPLPKLHTLKTPFTISPITFIRWSKNDIGPDWATFTIQLGDSSSIDVQEWNFSSRKIPNLEMDSKCSLCVVENFKEDVQLNEGLGKLYESVNNKELIFYKDSILYRLTARSVEKNVLIEVAKSF